ncbi:RNA methyltransferase [Treponema sp. OttesenSCG-928-L16]|nr:RNA methyltransferase [Treponema sp. OttesenSCG-928-L16]
MMPDLSIFSSLRDRDLRREGLIIGEGHFLSKRIAASCSLVAAAALPEARAEMESIAAGRCPVIEIPRAELSRITGYDFHRGMLLAAKRPAIPFIAGQELLEKGQRLLICAGISDPVNLGSVIRSASALGWEGIILDKNCADPFSRRVLRCSMGAGLSRNLMHFNTPEDMRFLREKGWTVAGTSLSGQAESPAALKLLNKAALMIGSEGFGLSAELQEQCGITIRIPQARNAFVDSLNVSAAAAILLWEGRIEGSSAPDHP